MNRRSLFGALAAVLTAPFLPAPVTTPLPPVSLHAIRADAIRRLILRPSPETAETAIRAHQTVIIERGFGRDFAVRLARVR